MSDLAVDDGSFSSENTGESETRNQHQDLEFKTNLHIRNTNTSLPLAKKKRNLPGTPDPTSEVIALSPSSLTATNRFVCEICNKGFQRDQNLQLHKRGHNLPWKLKQRTSSDTQKRVYVCPGLSCVHHNPARALGDLTGIKKHYSRKHGEKKWKCDKCLKKYAVQSDWKAHIKTCGTREYKCDCGTIFSRKDSFITHRAFCDALTEENNKVNQGMLRSQQISDDYTPCMSMGLPEFNNYNPKSPLELQDQKNPMFYGSMNMSASTFSSGPGTLLNNLSGASSSTSGLELSFSNGPSGFRNFGMLSGPMAHMSATALLQKAAEIGATGATSSNTASSSIIQKNYVTSMTSPYQPISYGPRPNPSYFNDQGPFHNVQIEPEGSNVLQNPNRQDAFRSGPEPGPKPVMDDNHAMNDIITYNEISKGGDQCLKLMSMEHGDKINSNSDLIQVIGDSGLGMRVPDSSGGIDTSRVDFLGIG